MADQKQSYDPKKGGKFEPTTKAQPAPSAQPGDNKNKEEVAVRPKGLVRPGVRVSTTDVVQW